MGDSSSNSNSNSSSSSSQCLCGKLTLLGTQCGVVTVVAKLYDASV